MCRLLARYLELRQILAYSGAQNNYCATKMPRQTSQDQLEAVLAAVSRFPDGARLEEIDQALAPKAPRRTLQRWLALLVRQNRLIADGRGRGRQYRLADYANAAGALARRVEVREEGEVYVPLSVDGEMTKRAVRQPIQARQPVGYNRDFLDAYRPNATFYLAHDLRRHLAEVGRSPDGERPAGTYARQIFSRMLIDLSWNSSRLEGNTYSLLETERLLELGESAEGKDARESQMILNHKRAIELLVDQAAEIGFNRYTILNLHALLSENLLSDPQAGGRLRTHGVEIGGSVYHPLAVPQLIEESFEQMLTKASAIEDPLEQAFFAMVHLPYLQPFADVNKRVSRLAANIPLVRRNLCPLSFVDMPERAYIEGILGVYELNRVDLLRDVFVWAYERSSARYSAIRQSLGEPDPFRLRYRAQVAEIVTAVVSRRMDKRAASALIRSYAGNEVPEMDRARFVEIAETELMSLHEGNIARYQLRPSEFQSWRLGWR
ncbi:MAG TPA: Fic family protein [Gammaproteobacteria bacterium]|nr:Fic family protein [Gammaproteobacteria bacterium]